MNLSLASELAGAWQTARRVWPDVKFAFWWWPLHWFCRFLTAVRVFYKRLRMKYRPVPLPPAEDAEHAMQLDDHYRPVGGWRPRDVHRRRAVDVRYCDDGLRAIRALRRWHGRRVRMF